MLKEEVSPEEIAEVVSKWTGIPVSKMLQGEAEKLLPSAGGGLRVPGAPVARRSRPARHPVRRGGG